MKIKLPNTNPFELSDCNYFIIGDKVFVCNQDRCTFKGDKSGDKIELPKKYHSEVLLNAVELEKRETGILVKVRR